MAGGPLPGTWRGAGAKGVLNAAGRAELRADGKAEAALSQTSCRCITHVHSAESRQLSCRHLEGPVTQPCDALQLPAGHGPQRWYCPSPPPHPHTPPQSEVSSSGLTCRQPGEEQQGQKAAQQQGAHVSFLGQLSRKPPSARGGGAGATSFPAALGRLLCTAHPCCAGSSSCTPRFTLSSVPSLQPDVISSLCCLIPSHLNHVLLALTQHTTASHVCWRFHALSYPSLVAHCHQHGWVKCMPHGYRGKGFPISLALGALFTPGDRPL